MSSSVEPSRRDVILRVLLFADFGNTPRIFGMATRLRRHEAAPWTRVSSGTEVVAFVVPPDAAIVWRVFELEPVSRTGGDSDGRHAHSHQMMGGFVDEESFENTILQSNSCRS